MDPQVKGNSTPMEGTDPDFVWQDYLDDTQSLAAPNTAFSHVEYSLESGFKTGMKLEIPNPDDATTYWLASVIMTCGDLLTLRYAGFDDDRAADFWFNIKSGEFHPVGWCSANNKKLLPPKSVLEKQPDVDYLLSKELRSTESIPASLSEDLNAGFMPIDQIKCSMKLELTEGCNPQNVWIVTIVQNVGGRLLLKYDGSAEVSNQDMWLFYLSDRLYPVGYAPSHNMMYCPPADLKNLHSDEEWDTILKNSLKESETLPFPAHILELKIPLEKHTFEVGMKLEAVNTLNYRDLCPATITKVIDEYHFLVTIDDHQTDIINKCVLCCNSNSPYVFPVNWAQENEQELQIPKGYNLSTSTFSWEEYLKYCNAKAAPTDFFPMCFMNMGFEVGVKLEAADPLCHGNINIATIVKIVEPLMWLHFDNEDKKEKYVVSSINSMDIFPVGWCASNSYPLRTPSVYRPKSKLSLVLNAKEENSEKSSQEVPNLSPTGQHGKSWCPKIYFNHRCFTGPLLSKSRLAELPQAIGPGPLSLVIQEVVYRVVNIAYKSSRVLQILQVEGKPTPGMQQIIIKAKYKGKTNRSTIEVIRNSKQVEDFCKNICLKLECCPYLFGPKHVGEVCPSNCHTQTKTKFGYNFVKKKKVGRPPLNPSAASSDNGEPVKRGPGRKKKKKHWSQLMSEKREQEKKEDKTVSRESSETDDTSKSEPKEKPPEETSQIPLIGKKTLKNTTSSSIVTRGAKLPNFGLWHHVSSFHNRRGRPRTRPITLHSFPPRKVGRPLGSTKKNNAVTTPVKKEKVIDICSLSSDDDSSQPKIIQSLPKPTLLDSNPLEWSVEDVVQYLQKTEYAPLAPLLKEQEIDGQALLMLNLFNVQEYLHLKPEPAKKFCYLIKNLKVEFFTHYVT